MADPAETQRDEARATDRAQLDGPPAGPSCWQRLCPDPAWTTAPLPAFEGYLDDPGTRARLEALEATERYPRPILEGLNDLGLPTLFVGAGRDTYRLCALNALLARRSGTLAITVGVNALGLLPAWIGASPEQLAAISERVRAGAFASMLLTELPHGSNLLRNQAHAVGGTLDADGTFQPSDADGPVTHYRVNGEKHLINGGCEHDHFFALLRTGHLDVDPSGTVKPLSARADFAFFWLERGPGVSPLPRWLTLPAQGADISGVRFEDVVVAKDRVLGRPTEGFSLVGKTLTVSRGCIAALASGTVSRARELALGYARRRNVYGAPIAELGAIAAHLLRLEALDRATAAISLKAAAMLNACGVGAAHYTAIAKLLGCDLAEEGVREGRQVLGARALLRELPFERLIRDVLLFGVFDGTSHVMLEEIAFRLERGARSAGPDGEVDTLARMREVYAAPAAWRPELFRKRRRVEVLPLPAHLRALAGAGGPATGPHLMALALGAEALFGLVSALSQAGTYREDQELRFTAGRLLGLFEVLAALAELGCPRRRQALGIPPALPEPGETKAFEEVVDRFALGWLGTRAVAGVWDLARQAGPDPGWLPAEVEREGGLAGLTDRLSRGLTAARHAFQDAVRGGRDGA